MRWPTGAAARDSISAIVILVICVVGMIQTSEFPARAAEWPMWMWGLLAALSLVLLFNSLRVVKPGVPRPEAKPDAEVAAGSSRSRRFRIAVNIALILGFITLVPIIGFYTAGALYLCTHMYYLGIRPPWKIAAVSAGTLIVFYAVFETFLGVLVPHGAAF